MAAQKVNENSLIARALFYAPEDIVKKLDLRAIVRLQQTCKALYQSVNNVAHYKTVDIKDARVRNGVIICNHTTKKLTGALESNFKINILKLLVEGTFNDDHLRNSFRNFQAKGVSINAVEMYTAGSCSIQMFTQFVETFRCNTVTFTRNCPLEYLTTPIMQKVNTLYMIRPVDCSPDFLLLSDIPNVSATFARDISKEFFRTILREVEAGQRNIELWTIQPFPADGLEPVLSLRKIVNSAEHGEHKERPLVVKKSSSIYTLDTPNGTYDIGDYAGGLTIYKGSFKSKIF